jgi:hypothetical protein
MAGEKRVRRDGAVVKKAVFVITEFKATRIDVRGIILYECSNFNRALQQEEPLKT